MDSDQGRALAARKKIRRAATLTREASRELAQAFDCDVLAAAHIRDHRDIDRAVQMIRLSLDRSPGPIDVTITGHVQEPQ